MLQLVKVTKLLQETYKPEATCYDVIGITEKFKLPQMLLYFRFNYAARLNMQK